MQIDTKVKLVHIKEKIDCLFNRLESTIKTDAKKWIIKEFDLEKYLINRNKYPSIQFCLNEKDIIELKNMGFINDQNKLTTKLSENLDEIDPITKLLYSMLWKNGDLGKENKIINGILNNCDDKLPDNGIVFYQFGKHLKNHNEPIIDQHVIRCFLIKNENNYKNIEKHLQIETLTKKHIKVVQNYKKWVIDTVKKGKYTTNDIDEILFGFGKMIKSKKEKS